MKVIGLHGVKGSGKDTTFEAIRELLPDHAVKRVAFADPMKVYIGRVLGYSGSPDEIIAAMNKLKEQGCVDSVYEAGRGTHLSGRQLLINVGQEARAQFGQEFWLDKIFPRPIYGQTVNLDLFYPDVDVLVVTDVRLENEFNRVYSVGGDVLHVRRDSAQGLDCVTERQHPGRCSGTIYNNGTLDHLLISTAAALEALGTC